MLGVIMARSLGGKKDYLKEFGNLSLIKRSYLNLKLGGCDEIIVILDEDDKDIEKELYKMDAVFKREPKKENRSPLMSLYHTVKDLNREGTFLYITADMPNLDPETVKEIIEFKERFVLSFYRGKKGALIKFPIDKISKIRNINCNTFEEAVDLVSEFYKPFETKDPGVLKLDASKQTNDTKMPLRPVFKVSIAGEERFFGPGVYRLLILINDLGSVKDAAQAMGISYSKAWKMIHTLENELNENVIVRKAGGMRGGESFLSEGGKIFITKYEKFLELIKKEGQKLFSEIFG